MGDFNLNLLRFQTCIHTENFVLFLQSFNLTPTIDKPTRVHNNIFISDLDDNISSGNKISDLTDHFCQFCIIESPGHLFNPQRSKRLVRDFSHYSETNFLNDLSQLHLSEVICSKTDVNKSFTAFYKLLNKHAPLKPLSKRNLKQLRKPWIIKGIRRSIKIKNSLYSSGDLLHYKLYRNKISTFTRLSKKTFFHKYFEENFTNIKKTWEGINDLLG